MVFGAVLTWWFWFEVLGLVGLPVVLWLLRRLPDRGYPFARPIGLLLSGYFLWLGGSLGWWSNGLRGILISMTVVLVGGLLVLRVGKEPLLARAGQWWRERKAEILTTEVLFGLVLLGWAVFKSYNPNLETAGGEKWMEIAFVNSVLRGDSFPPADPWLSGYGISYYYFGYVLMSMVTRLSGLPPAVAYNLFVPSLLALSVTGSFSIVFNLVQLRTTETASATNLADAGGRRHAIGFGLLGSVFVCLLGNLEGSLEVIHSKGLLPLSFWRWLDIKDLNVAADSTGWLPTRFMWWWRASRVIHDCSIQGWLAGNCNPPNGDWEVIDEFPFFSFLLGDVHPHVLALPFVLLVVALALGVMRTISEVGGCEGMRAGGGFQWTESAPQGMRQWVGRWRSAVQTAFGSTAGFFVVALLAGSLGFLNTWDFPIYLIVVGAVVVVYVAKAGWDGWWQRAVVVVAGIAVVGAALYLPFYLSFSSQAGGVLPNLFNPTKLQQFLVFFGHFVVIVVAFLAVTTIRRRGTGWTARLVPSLVATVAVPVLLFSLIVLAASFVPPLRQWAESLSKTPGFEAALGGSSVGSLLALSARIRIGNPWTFLLLGGLSGWCLALLWPSREQSTSSTEDGVPAPDMFVLILIGVGLALPLAVEFVYLRDNFGIRMNTVFKFYFQSWVLLALASAYGAYVVLEGLRGTGRMVWRVLLGVVIAAGLVYPILAIPSKAGSFENPPRLDGMAWLEDSRPDDYAGIVWLARNAHPGAIVLEAPGDSYAAYQYTSRVSALTGLPTLLGWGNHESQWRGSYEIPAQREPDIDLMFNTVDMRAADRLLERYDVDYVFIGSLERERFNEQGLAKFSDMLTTVYEGGNVTIYQRLAVDEP